ncbi:hypothetical protein NDU88_007412 [Pleurodeles waltl]|uniref:Uncharacterized protein n=1 Tax=Pleurodeles waltl TaxID=8319 RepID=A0AAV7PNX3_PLEWA|nr:hypothetical protein NDU88_007412 [Pleurodeles waltl]
MVRYGRATARCCLLRGCRQAAITGVEGRPSVSARRRDVDSDITRCYTGVPGATNGCLMCVVKFCTFSPGAQVDW